MYRDGFYVHHAGPGVFAWLFMTLLILLLVILVVAVLARFAGPRGPRWWGPGAGHGRGPDQAVELLRLRYARGEVDRETFLAASADLGGQRLEEPAQVVR